MPAAVFATVRFEQRATGRSLSVQARHTARRAIVRAQIVQCLYGGHHTRTYERVLRYPGGKVRIRNVTIRMHATAQVWHRHVLGTAVCLSLVHDALSIHLQTGFCQVS